MLAAVYVLYVIVGVEFMLLAVSGLQQTHSVACVEQRHGAWLLYLCCVSLELYLGFGLCYMLLAPVRQLTVW